MSKNTAQKMLARLVRQQEGCCFIATSGGRVLEANQEGWALLDAWLRHHGHEALMKWMQRSAGDAIPPNVIQVGHRRYRLSGTRLPMHDDYSGQPAYCVACEELLADGAFSLEYVIDAYRLTKREAELLNLRLLCRGIPEIAALWKVHPAAVQHLHERLVRKLNRRKDRLVRFTVQR
ncbi:MAG: hypothetical protein KIS92_13335 [Planctomycetota bacterium]|nr:hypothetical protein [Planctomycetota bacterium]